MDKINENLLKLGYQTYLQLLDEIKDHQARFAMLFLRNYFENQVGHSTDDNLNRKLDCVIYLLEN